VMRSQPKNHAKLKNLFVLLKLNFDL